MRVALSKTTFESEIASRFGGVFNIGQKPRGEVMSTGVAAVDSIMGGLPRGAITEIYGPASSGRTSFMLSVLARATADKEACALIDTSDAFDPVSTAGTELDLDQLLWVRCAANIEHAFKASDLLLQGGGFGLVLLDLGDVAAKDVRRIISSWWYRFRRKVENTPTALVVISPDSCVRSCAALALKMNRHTDLWSSPVHALPINSSATPNVSRLQITHSNLLSGMKVRLDRQRPLHMGEGAAEFNALVNAAGV